MSVSAIASPRLARPRPQAVIKTIVKIQEHFDYKGPIGVGFPGIVVDGVVYSAVNIHNEWREFNAEKAIAKATGCDVDFAQRCGRRRFCRDAFRRGQRSKGRNDALHAGHRDRQRDVHATITACLISNSGISICPGHAEDAERYTSDRARTELDLSWEEWGGRLDEYFQYIEFLFTPQLIIIGGGVSKKHDKYMPYIKTRVKVVPAQLLNEAGIIGAATAAAQGGECSV